MRGRAWMAIGLLLAAGKAEAMTQAELDGLAAGLGYRFAVVDNHPQCPPGILNCFLATLTITAPAQMPADATGLALYFSYVNQPLLVESDVFQHEHVNGDLQRLTLKPGARLEPGSQHAVRIWGLGANFSRAFAMPNAYLAADGLQARTIAATRPVTDPETGREVLPFVAPMTDEARLATKGPPDETLWRTPERDFAAYAAQQAPAATGIAILPKPVQAQQAGGAAIPLGGGLKVQLKGVQRAQLAPALQALAAAGAPEGGALPLSIRIDRKQPAEGYSLRADAKGVAIAAGDAAGANHALRSLAQQVAFEGGRLTPLIVEDAPHYGFRGLHLDLGRNFHGRDEILKLMEAMAAYKLNRLHLHLADDEGWRIEIPALPELAQVGSKRCHDPGETHCLLPQLGAGPDGAGAVNGYLTAADYIAIVQAAAARGIEVIPSIDMPGHSRAAIRAMEVRHARLLAEGKPAEADRFRLIDPDDRTKYDSIQHYRDNTLNVCIPSTYRFVDTVVAALADMHRQAGAPLRTFHIGADETAGAWVDSPACKAMIAENGGDPRKLGARFIEQVAAHLTARHIRTAGWSDGLGHTDPARMPKDVQTNIWGTVHGGGVAEAHEQLNRGWKVVLSIPDLGYLDMPYVPHPEEGGYDWASRSVDTPQIFGFMPDNLPANAALIRTIKAQQQPVEDKPQKGSGHEIAGVQAQLWSETIRTDAGMEYQLFPRLLALAERGWSAAPWTPPYQPGASYQWQDQRIDLAAMQAGWRDFAGRLAAQLPALDRAGIAYRVAPPGAKIVDGRLEANTAFPGMAIEMRTPGGQWTPYAGPIAVSGPVELRARSADGKRASRTVTVSATPR